jgi:histidinol-phosphate aminotransferase
MDVTDDGDMVSPDLSVLAGPEPVETGVIRLDLNVGANSPVFDEGHVREVFSSLRDYGHPSAEPLRREIARSLSHRHRRDLSAAEVAVGAGSMAILRDAVSDAVATGSPAVMFQPGYAAMRRLAVALGADVVTLPRTSTGGIPVAAVVTAVADAAAPLIVLNHPVNPTGQPEDIEAVIALHTQLPRAVILIDEAYWEYSARPSALDITHTVERVVVVRTFSKARGLAGIRLGYAVADPARVHRWMSRTHPGAISAMTQALGILALGEDDSVFAQRVAETLHERERIAQGIRASWRIPPLDSSANFVFIPLGSRAQDVHTRLRELGIWVRLIRDEPGILDGVRVSVGTPAHNSQFLSVLDDVKRFI